MVRDNCVAQEFTGTGMKIRHLANQALRAVACACLLAVACYAKAGAHILAQAIINANKDDSCFLMETVKKGDVTELTYVTSKGCKTGEVDCMLNELNTLKPTGDIIESSFTLEGNCNKIVLKIKKDSKEEDYHLHIDNKIYRQDYEKSGYFQALGDWPADEYTLLIPKPDLAFPWHSVLLRKRGSSSFELTVNCERDPSDETAASLTPDFIAKRTKAYIEILKAKGFTKDAKLFDGMPPFAKTGFAGSVLPVAYHAKNSKGYFVRVLTDKNMCFVSLKDPAYAEKTEKK